MSDKVKIRLCAKENCTVRLSSIEKDEHVLCPTHTGWQCNYDTRCDICRNWSEDKMKDYLKLQAGKARRKVYKDKKRAEKRAAGETSADHAHSLSPSSFGSSQDLSGETVPSPVTNISEFVNKTIVSKNLVIGEGIDQVNLCSPSAPPPPVGQLGEVGQVSVVSCGVNPIVVKGNDNPAPLKEAGEFPSHTSQQPQSLATPKVGEGFKTPSTVRSFSSSRLTPGALSVLRGVLREHEGASEQEKLRLMAKSLKGLDSSFRGSLSAKSVRSVGTIASEATKRVKSAELPTQISVSQDRLEVIPISEEQESINKLELTREWAKMVQTGGVTVKPGTSCYYKDKAGVETFVVPPTGSCPGGEGLKQKIGSLALSAAVESSPSGNVTPGMTKKLSPFQGSEGGGIKVTIPLDIIRKRPRSVSTSPPRQVSPRERPVSPHRSLKRALEEGGGGSSSPARRRGKETPRSLDGSPHHAGESPQKGGEGLLSWGRARSRLLEFLSQSLSRLVEGGDFSVKTLASRDKRRCSGARGKGEPVPQSCLSRLFELP